MSRLQIRMVHLHRAWVAPAFPAYFREHNSHDESKACELALQAVVTILREIDASTT